VETFRDKAHTAPSSYCKPCNNLEMKRRRENRANARSNYERYWVQKQRDGTRLAASRPCPNACEVCGVVPEKDGRRPLDFDHCHTGGIFRGWICHGCNMIVGYAKDDSERLRKLAQYLEDFELTR
jgi:hypothetical protein